MKTKTIVIGFKATKELRRLIDEVAEKEKRSRSNLCKSIVETYCEASKK